MSPRVLRTAAIVCLLPAAAAAQTIPFADTEDATLSEIEVGPGDIHPVLSLDLRNGDYARGAYDDDDAGLGRVPVHLAIGGAIVLDRRRDGAGALFLLGQSSNGLHAPGARERTRPRAWYESNNLLGLAWRSAGGVSAAATYTIKTSPNGVAATTHEASLTVLYSGDRGLAALKPRLAVTRRTQGPGGFYTIAGIAPELALSAREDGPSLSLPLLAGVGWGGFYGTGSGDRAYASGGVSIAQPLRLGERRAALQFELLALARDTALRRRDAPAGTTATIIPYATLSLSMAW
ncbi:MAG: hypothetical protein ABW173_04265 [Sphingomonas sp.]